MNIIAVGHNHSTAPLEMREQLTFDSARLMEALQALHDVPEVQESAILSTCNRNELYCVVSEPCAAAHSLADFLLDFHGASGDDLRDTLYTHNGDSAVRHLFEVASGVDSLIVGETQILSQLKDAYSAARSAGASGPILNKLFHRCFEIGKKVRHETAISQGAVSVSFAAVELSRKIFTNLEHKAILLIGAGETSELTAMNLANNGVSDFMVANRTYDRAVQLAERLRGTAIELDQIERHAAGADIIITSTAARSYVLSKEALSALMQERKNAPLFIIDLGVPRDIDPEAAGLYNLFLYDIDDLAAIAEQNKKKRAREIARANRLIDKAVDGFMEWHRTLEVTPTLVSLRNHFEEVRRSEVEHIAGSLPPEQRELLDKATRGIVNKLLHTPSVEMKRAAGNGSGHLLTQSIRKLFKLGEKDE